jgi:hypothetical protein
MRLVPIVSIVGALWATAANGQRVVSPPTATAMQILSRMAGCWRQETETSATIDEMWMAPAGEMMLGSSRTSAKGRTVEYEFMRIRSDASGVTFLALLPGQPETAFRLVKIDVQTVVFENAMHDFPQRVIYRIERDMLTGRIEGTQNGKTRSVDYPMRRVACPTSP